MAFGEANAKNVIVRNLKLEPMAATVVGTVSVPLESVPPESVSLESVPPESVPPETISTPEKDSHQQVAAHLQHQQPHQGLTR